MKKILLLAVFIAMQLVSCKPTSTVITSKQKAIALKIYKPTLVATTASKSDVTADKKTAVPKKQQSDDVNIELPTSDAGIDEFENLDKVIYRAENADFRNELIESAKENIGSPYQSGGMSKRGFDCSGFVYTVFKSFDVTLPRTSTEMSNFGRGVAKEDVRKGDLIFFRTNGSARINHVGMVIESDADGIKFIHSSTQRGVIISTTKEGYYQKTFAQVNRVVE